MIVSMSVVESIVDAIGSPVGIRCTAYGYFDGETVPSGNTSREGLQVTDQSHTVIHHYVINDDVLKASKDEQDQLLDNALRKCLHTHYDRHVRSFLSKKQYLDLPPEAYPVLFLYETYDSGDPYDGGFAHYQGQPTLPEGLTSQTIQPGEHNIIVPDKTSVKQCKEEAIQHVSNEVPSLPRSLDAIQHLYDKPPKQYNHSSKLS